MIFVAGRSVRYPDSFYAIIAAVDTQGIGVIRALKEQNIKIPDQIRVISLTGYRVGRMLETSLTSMEMPAFEMGEKAAMMTIDAIESKSDSKKSGKTGGEADNNTSLQHLMFSSILSERETT